MQTFLPEVDFTLSAKRLDRQRLGKQRVETKQIYTALRDPSYGWQNHPAVKMWRGREDALALYGFRICQEWQGRGYNDTLLDWFLERMVSFEPPMPQWIGDESFHRSHRSNLIRKDPGHYALFWPTVPADLPYVWPQGDLS